MLAGTRFVAASVGAGWVEVQRYKYPSSLALGVTSPRWKLSPSSLHWLLPCSTYPSRLLYAIPPSSAAYLEILVSGLFLEELSLGYF